MNAVPATVDEYIESFSSEVQAVLRAVRATVRQAAPQAEERISYRMPALFQNGAVVYYGAFKNHLGLFPPVADPALLAKVAPYAGPKGNLQFPYSQPVPHELIAAVVQARLRSNAAKAAAKSGRAKAASVKRRASGTSAALPFAGAGPPPAWHLAREALWSIIRLAGQAPHRRRPLSSNVRPQDRPIGTPP